MLNSHFSDGNVLADQQGEHMPASYCAEAGKLEDAGQCPSVHASMYSSQCPLGMQ